MTDRGEDQALEWWGPGGEALLHALFDATNVMAGVFEVEADDFRYVAANRNAAAVFGRVEGGLNGLSGRDLGQSEREVAARMELLRTCLETGRPQVIEYPFRRDGELRYWFLGTFSPVPGDKPRVSFMILDITERHRAQAAAEAQGARLALTLEATGLGIWEYDIAADRVDWDLRTRELFGVGPDEPIDFAAYAGRIHPDDLPTVRAAYEAALAGADEGRYVVEHRTAAGGAAGRWVRGAGRVLFDAKGRATRVLGTAQDVTDQVAARERQALLSAELNHRVKNSLAAVQAIANQTLRASGGDMAAFRRAFQSRLMSLARGHELLTRTAWAAAGLTEVLQVALEPFEAAAIVIDGPVQTVRLSPELSLNMVMVLHELATNAAKYGALSREGGEIRIGWRVEAGALVLDWRETGGPPVAPPRRNGFGARLKNAALRAFGGSVENEFAPDGLRCRFRLPLGQFVEADGTAGRA